MSENTSSGRFASVRGVIDSHFMRAVDRMARVASTRVAGVITGLLNFYLQRQRRIYNRQLVPFHDVCAVLPFVDPNLLTYRDAHVAVELDGSLTRGMTVTDFRGVADIGLAHICPSLPVNGKVAVAADGPAIVAHVLDTILEPYDGLSFTSG